MAKNLGNADVIIEGDLKAQQAIRFNIFQLYQTYTGKNPKLNIGPKDLLEKSMVVLPIGIQKHCLPLFKNSA